MTNKTTATNKVRPILCIELLKTFSPTELKNLEKVLSFEYFNTDDWIQKLLKALEKHVLNSGVFDDEKQCKVYQEVFEHLPTPEGVLKKNERDWLNKNLNKLIRMAELFLSIQELKKNNYHKCDLLYPELLARKQYQLFNRHINKDKKTLDKRDNKGVEYYRQKYKIEKAVRDYLYQSGRFLTKEDNLSDLIQNLDMYYALDKLALYITALSMRHVPDKGKYDLSSMETIAPLLDLPQYIDTPLIVLHRATINLMKTESETAYFDLLNYLDQYEPIVPTDALKGFYTVTVNHFVGQITRGRLDYNGKMFDLYKIMDKKNLLADKDFIPVVKLKNVVTVSCRVKEYEWATNFIERYRMYIREDIRDSVCHYNLGTIAFHQKDYATAHSKFIQVGKVNRTYDINVRAMILKCLYEKEKDYNDYTMQSFRSAKQFFRENKSLPTKTRMSYTNFIKILIPLYRLRHDINKTQADIERLKEKLNKQKINSHRGWLLEKIQELEHKIK